MHHRQDQYTFRLNGVEQRIRKNAGEFTPDILLDFGSGLRALADVQQRCFYAFDEVSGQSRPD